MYWAITTQSLVDTAVNIGWDSSLTRATIREFENHYKVPAVTARMFYRRLLDSNMVVQEFRSNNQSCGQYRWIIKKA